MIRIAVLVSGNGSNLQALIDAKQAAKNRGETPGYDITLVIADRENTYAIQRAEKAGIQTTVVLGSEKSTLDNPKECTVRDLKRLEISNQILMCVRKASCDAIVLAGFLTILRGPIITEYANRIVNVHPSLLPKFGGKGMWGHHVHKAVLVAGEKESGCTIHLVDAGCDTGPILLQKKVPVLKDDTAKSLAARISKVEHQAIVEGVRELVRRVSSELATR